jgi:hypothetical protein
MFEEKKRCLRGQFFDDSLAHSGSTGQEATEKWTAGSVLQPE